jgi:Tol biopolymer transport system component
VFVSDRGGSVNLWQVDVGSKELRQLTVGPGSDGFPVVSQAGVLAFGQYRHQTNVHVLQLAGSADQPLPIQGGWNFPARFSPDGLKVVYQSNRTGNPDLWLHDLAGGSDRQLTNNPSADRLASWFPDGRSILFQSDRDGGVPGVWTMNIDGGGLRKLRDRSAGSARISPDGATIAFLERSDRGPALWTMDRKGTAGPTALVGLLSFVWYRDSKRVLYTRQAGPSSAEELRAMNLETGGDILLAQGVHNELEVAPDGSGLTYCRGSGRNQQLFLLRLEPAPDSHGLPRSKGKPEQLTNGMLSWHAHNGGWSPDAKRVIYTRATDEGDIYVIENYR